MDWVLRNPQIHSIFGNLGYVHADGYHINENCNSVLENILHNILTEDKCLRTFRRSISFGQNVRKDLIPLLIHAKEDKTIELLTRIFVNLTVPINCLLSVDDISRNDCGRHTVFEINNLLATTKNAFTDQRATKVVVDYLKKSVDNEQKVKLLPEQTFNICNSLLLLRNILHIPEDNNGAQSPAHSSASHLVQNQILWNIFSQSIDKVLIKMMSIPEACHWGVTMVQVIALLYKDQHVVSLHKLINIWLETSLSDSSEDNESNTSPPDRCRIGSDNSSRMLTSDPTSDPTSDSSDTGASGKSNGIPNGVNKEWESSQNNANQNANQASENTDSNKTNVKENVSAEKNSSAETSNLPVENSSSEKSIPTEDNSSTEINSEKENGLTEEKCSAEENIISEEKTLADENGTDEKKNSVEENITAEEKTLADKNGSDENAVKENSTAEEDSSTETNSLTDKNSSTVMGSSVEENNLVIENKSTDINSPVEENSLAEKSAADSVIPDNDTAATSINGTQAGKGDTTENNNDKKVISETSDCGYGTQIEKESFSTSSNDDDAPAKKPVHQKPHNPKQRANTKVRSGTNPQERKRKKLVKRGKSNIINVQGLTHKTPTNDDISNVIKEFTVDFLLKGYNSLVQTLHYEMLSNTYLPIDKSHFFWLVTYFLKFATQIELDWEHVDCVLSFNIMSYLTAEGVNLCEQFELAIKLDGNDLCPSVRRLHLVVTAIREFVQALDFYKRIPLLNEDDEEAFLKLQAKICETEELRSLLVLLLRHYNPKYQTKQYLQDLIVTNHMLLVFLDNVMKMPKINCSANMVDHLKQFATPHVMNQYGILLEDYESNGEFVNDCIFTVMHHVSGSLDSLITLYQPRILRTFTCLWKSDFGICDDWYDLVEYVINTFVKKPQTLQTSTNFRFDTESFDDDKFSKMITEVPTLASSQNFQDIDDKRKALKSSDSCSSKDRWTEDEISSLSWTYMQCSTSADVIGEVIKMFKEDGIIKSQMSVIRELFKQNIINKDHYDTLLKDESDGKVNKSQANQEMRDDEISKLCEQLSLDGNAKFLDWVQKVLLDACYAKICTEKTKESLNRESKTANFESFKKEGEIPVVSPVSYHSLLLNQSVPLIPWNCQQASICKDLKFLQLLHKLGFQMPVDTGKVFIRIPNFWTADILYDVASKISPIDTSKLKFSVNEFAETSASKAGQDGGLYNDADQNIHFTEPGHFYQIHKQTYTMINFTPMPGCSYSSDTSEIDNGNWLKVVQKSQEINLTITVDSCSKLIEPDVLMRTPCIGLLSAPEVAVPSFGLPSIMTVKQEVSFSAHFVNERSNLSTCETASVVSVSSDLTCMYVSDEDERPEEPPTPPSRRRDHDDAYETPNKRPRIS